ncbi:MAG: polyprenyl synthetase family protein [Pseudomonadota bacterium]|nr:polyprenyl synthetase family protein [Pseudomonadota bacterium]
MTSQAALKQANTASLDALYGLVQSDLRRVDDLILGRVREEIPLIHGVAQHIIASGGKRIRPALLLISAQLCGYTGERHIRLAGAVEFIHTATLLHDDVVDESRLRRGLATANATFGNKASILVGDFLLGQAFQLMVGDGSLKSLKILSDAAAIIARGELLQMMTEGEPATAIATYLEVISAKTAVLFSAACELGAVVAGTDARETPLREFGSHIGMAFQLIDDALDYAANQVKLGKTVGDDFREGKITLPVILAYGDGNPEEKAFWQRTLGSREQEPNDLATAQRCLQKHDAIARTIALAGEYCHKARQSLSGFAAGPARAAMLDIVDFCAARSY